MLTRRILLAATTVTLASVTAWAAALRPDAPSATLKSVDSGAMRKAGYYMPQRLMLTTAKPASIVKEPAYANKPLYGDLKFGPDDRHVGLALDESPDTYAAKLYLDS